MKIAVFGGTGGVGKHFVEQALKQGHSLRVLARAESVPSEWRGRAGLEIVIGSPLEAERVAETLRGAEAVVSSLGLKRANPANPWSKLVSPRDFASATVRIIAAEMTRAGVTRLIA